jgi:glycosyltransferase involved in cell wall biosynthesis
VSRLKEITVFSIGDANDLKAWSNVPYFFTKNLEDTGIKVNRVNLEENALLAAFYKCTVYVLLKVLYKNSAHTYFRSGVNYFLTSLKIRRALKTYDHTEVLIFLTYSFSARRYTSKKIVLFSDWSYLYLIKTFMKREPYWFEKPALAREKKHIDSADLVLSLFPQSLAFNRDHYQNPECHYLGNVINSNYPLHKDQLLALKTNSHTFLFIGNRKYIRGALDLIHAYKELLTKDSGSIELDIIGLNENDTGIILPGLHYYGYLDKGRPEQNELYYQLVSKARAIVNTTPGWGAFSAMTEAMYYYTPVITTPYGEFLETYGSEIDFGYYVTANSTRELSELMQRILTDEKYPQMMHGAYEKVKGFTWAAYTEKLLILIS